MIFCCRRLAGDYWVTDWNNRNLICLKYAIKFSIWSKLCKLLKSVGRQYLLPFGRTTSGPGGFGRGILARFYVTILKKFFNLHQFGNKSVIGLDLENTQIDRSSFFLIPSDRVKNFYKTPKIDIFLTKKIITL